MIVLKNYLSTALFKIKGKKLLKRFLFFSTITVVTFFMFVASINYGFWGEIPDRDTLKNISLNEASTIYDSENTIIGNYFLQNRQSISYEELPTHLINALIATEDARYYNHNGIDYQSLTRVLFKTILLQDKSSGGGSTISQQLAKNLFPRAQNSRGGIVVQKIREMLIARKIETLFNKKEILERYLNTVAFSENVYGIEGAAYRFFNKQTKVLSVEEAALLVGTLKATYTYNPRKFPERSKERRNLVLRLMADQHFLSPDSLERLQNKPVKLNYQAINSSEGDALYFKEMIRKNLLTWAKEYEEQTGKKYNIYTDGLQVYTTLNSDMQRLAEQVVKEHMYKLQKNFESEYGKNAPWAVNNKLILKKLRTTQIYKNLKAKGLGEQSILDSLTIKRKTRVFNYAGQEEAFLSVKDSMQHMMKFLNLGFVSVNAVTGGIECWVGGVDFNWFKYDNVYQSERQVGSLFKPVVYSAAIENGIKPCDYFSARAIQYENMEDWTPTNSGDKDEKYLNYSIPYALSHSVNTVAVKVMEKTGISNVIQQAQKMGIDKKLPEVPSLALGTGEVDLLTMVKSYSTFLNEGYYIQPFAIREIRDKNGNLLSKFKPEKSKKEAFSKETALTMLEMMKGTINEGTASSIRSQYHIKEQIAGKTGTTQNNKDAWFMALTPKHIYGSWVGTNSYEIGFKTTATGQGAKAALPLFAMLYKKMTSNKKLKKLTTGSFSETPERIVEALDCKEIKKDGFFKRLFTNPNKTRKRNFKKRESD